jgi:hypothetical protein
MDLTKILSISGKSGLFLVVAQTKTGAIVEAFSDKRRFPVFASEKMSSLEEISIFTTDEDIPLKDVFKKIFEKENGGAVQIDKDNNAVLKAYMEEILPEFDKERVYVSDMKKLFTWYNLLQEKEMLDFTEETENTDQEETPSQTEKETDGESNA